MGDRRGGSRARRRHPRGGCGTRPRAARCSCGRSCAISSRPGSSRSDEGRYRALRADRAAGIPRGREGRDRAAAVAPVRRRPTRRLRAGAVIGRDFRLDVLQRVTDARRRCAARRVRRGDGGPESSTRAAGGRGRWAFTHALVRQALYDELSMTRQESCTGGSARRSRRSTATPTGAHLAGVGLPLHPGRRRRDSDKAIDYASGRRAIDRPGGLRGGGPPPRWRWRRPKRPALTGAAGRPPARPGRREWRAGRGHGGASDLRTGRRPHRCVRPGAPVPRHRQLCGRGSVPCGSSLAWSTIAPSPSSRPHWQRSPGGQRPARPGPRVPRPGALLPPVRPRRSPRCPLERCGGHGPPLGDPWSLAFVLCAAAGRLWAPTPLPSRWQTHPRCSASGLPSATGRSRPTDCQLRLCAELELGDAVAATADLNRWQALAGRAQGSGRDGAFGLVYEANLATMVGRFDEAERLCHEGSWTRPARQPRCDRFSRLCHADVLPAHAPRPPRRDR